MNQSAEDRTALLRERLDRLAGSVSGGDSIDGARLYRQGVRRRRRRIAATTGLVVTGVVIAGVALGAVIRPEASSPGPAPLDSDPAPPSPGCELTDEWARLVEDGMPRDQACDAQGESTVQQGDAAAELVLEDAVVEPGEPVSFRLVNRGDLQLVTGLVFAVQRWDGQEWVTAPWDVGVPSVPIALDPGDSTEWQQVSSEGAAGGWYRIEKSARYQDGDYGDPAKSLLVRTLFELRPN